MLTAMSAIDDVCARNLGLFMAARSELHHGNREVIFDRADNPKGRARINLLDYLTIAAPLLSIKSSHEQLNSKSGSYQNVG